MGERFGKYKQKCMEESVRIPPLGATEAKKARQGHGLKSSTIHQAIPSRKDVRNKWCE